MEEKIVEVHSESFKFSSAHFIARQGFRERLHGHNYTVGLRVAGNVCQDGYVVDFGDMKKVTREVCKKLDHLFLLPMKSDVLDIHENGSQIEIRTEDGSFYSLPANECIRLPTIHSSAEELTEVVWVGVVEALGVERLRSRGVQW
eukprot:Filipodium_phascolosomae@DN3596_c0_g1_i1.p1